MLFLCFSIDNERYALPTAKVRLVIPRVSIKRLHQAPDWILGLINYHGLNVPVIDLCQLSIGKKAKSRLSSRIILVYYTAYDDTEHLLGLLAEQVNETIQRDVEEFKSTGVELPEIPYFDGVAHDQDGMIQWVEVDSLLPDSVQNMLFQNSAETAQ